MGILVTLSLSFKNAPIAKSKQAMKQVLGIKDEAARMKVTPPLAVASLAHGDRMSVNSICE